jgi:hypothetical protein
VALGKAIQLKMKFHCPVSAYGAEYINHVHFTYDRAAATPEASVHKQLTHQPLSERRKSPVL